MHGFPATASVKATPSRYDAPMTPAINLLKREKIAHTVRSYVHDAHAESYGGEAVDKLGLDPAQVFKTLLASTETHELLVAIVPVAGQLDLKALAEAAGCKKCEMAAADAAQRATGTWSVASAHSGRRSACAPSWTPAPKRCPRCMSAPGAVAWRWNWHPPTCCG
jgi:Cys-tRNA(Pro) deacylase